MDAHRGRLFVEGNRHGLSAGISIDARHLYVRTENESWSWPLRDVVVMRWQGNQFKLTMSDEEFLFTADRPLTFTFEVVDHLTARRLGESRRQRRSTTRRRPGGRSKSMTANDRPRRERPKVDSVTKPIPEKVDLTNVWTDLATGRDESSLLESLADLSRGHQHHWEAGDDHSDGALRVCTECQKVVVDLIAAEETVAAEENKDSDPWRSLE